MARLGLHPSLLTLPAAAFTAACSGAGPSASAAADAGPPQQASAEAAAPNSDAPSSATACDSIPLAAPAAGEGIQLQIPLTLGPGEEREVCQLVKLPRDLNANWTEGVMTEGSHHALVIRTGYTGTIPATTLDGQTLDGTQVHTCSTPSALWQVGGVLAGARHQTAATDANYLPKGALPANVAYKLKEGDYVLLNFHMLNPSANSLNACYKANLNGVPESQVTDEAGTMFWYDPFITVPANGRSSARMACPITQDVHLVSAVSHAHKRLVSYTANLLTGDPESGGTTVGTLYAGSAWDSPTPTIFSQPLALTKGQWIDYQCQYENPENRNVAQGLQTTDEMCMFIGPYWPRDPNLDACVAAGNPSGASLAGHIYGYGTKTGADFLSCFWQNPQRMPLSGGPSTSDQRFAKYGCMTQTCSKASVGITAFLDCLGQNAQSCQTQCAKAAACTVDCLQTSCKSESAALSAATCD